MRPALGLLASRVLRTRYGIALLLGAVVLVIVGIAQLAGRDDGAGRLTPRHDAQVTANPTAGNDGELSAPAVPTPVVSPGALPPDGVAVQFAAAWVTHVNVDSTAWLARLRPFVTPALGDKLTGVDPASVPANRVTGAAKTTPRGESFVEVALPVDSGLLRLRLIATAGHWLVDGVDWERA